MVFQNLRWNSNKTTLLRIAPPPSCADGAANENRWFNVSTRTDTPSLLYCARPFVSQKFVAIKFSHQSYQQFYFGILLLNRPQDL